jgi:hypothetical protein
MAWQRGQPAGGYVAYNPADSTYELPAEQAMVVANEDSPVFFGGAFETMASCYADHDVFVDASAPAQESAGRTMTTGCSPTSSGSSVPPTPPTLSANGYRPWMAWSRSCGRERALPTWCGLGASTVIMAQAFEHSTFAGLRHPRAVDRGRPHGRGAGRREPAGQVRRRAGEGLPGPGLRPGMPVRRPARHWETRPGRLAASGRPLRRTARCCWSSRTPATPPSTT